MVGTYTIQFMMHNPAVKDPTKQALQPLDELKVHHVPHCS